MKTTSIGNDIDKTAQADKNAVAPSFSTKESRTDFSQQQHKKDKLMPTVQAAQKVDIYEKITERILSHLEAGTAPWRQTWGTYGLAKNFLTNHVYTGINMVMLNMVAPYEVPYYLTWKQLKSKGGVVKKGSKAEYVYYYKSYFKDGNGRNIGAEEAQRMESAGQEVQNVRFLKCFKVFNITSIEGIEWEKPTLAKQENEPITECETFLQSIQPRPKFKRVNANRAFYAPHEDIINIPDIQQFEQNAAFYNTTFHELAHWTGHKNRLARKGIMQRIDSKSKVYAEEELLAELSASFLCGLTGIDRVDIIENNAAYLKHWIDVLRTDNRMLLRVAPRVQEAVNFLTKNY